VESTIDGSVETLGDRLKRIECCSDELPQLVSTIDGSAETLGRGVEATCVLLRLFKDGKILVTIYSGSPPR
jgi:hypothetical protein